VSACGPSVESTLFRDVLVVDGTGAAPYAGSVRVLGDRIVGVGDLAARRGEAVVEGNGAVLAPGFIDTHSHHDRGLLDGMRSARAAVSQGITTIVVGQDGGSSYPLRDFFAEVEATPPAVNVASYTGHAALRRRVMGDDLLRPATPEEVEAMAALLRVDMEAGSLGLSTGLEYTAGFNSTTEEVVALARVAAEYDGRYISHIRSEDRRFWEAIAEIIHIGQEVGLPVQVSHMKLAMTSLWGRADELVDTLDAARARGVAITADVYPYTYWSSTMTVLVPDGNFTRDEVAFALREVAQPDGIIFGRFSPEPAYEGRTLEEIAAERGEDPVTAYLALREMVYGPDAPEGASESIVARSMIEEDVGKMYLWPHTNVSSDGALAGAHPRGYGSFARVLRTQVREQDALSLEDAVHRMTGLSAEHMGFSDRGVIREGARADLVLFDPRTVTDHADFESPQLPSTGIHGVWVNGVRVWDGESAGESAYPGRVIRRGG
jgi:N-acyl-D-amino-acid deacylase